MQQFFEFLLSHWMLTAALVIVLILLVLEETRAKVGGVMKLTPAQLTQMINHDNVMIIDIRSPSQFDAGHIVGANSMTSAAVLDNPKKLVKNKTKAIVLVCQAGQSSLTTATKLHKQGYEKVFSLAGGMNAWRRENMPVVAGRA